MVSGLDVPQGVRLNPRNAFEVCDGMSVQAAINAAAAQVPAPSATNPWTILLYPGIYNEAVIGSPWVNLKGVGPRGSVVIIQNDASNILTLANNVEVSDLTIRLGTPTAARNMVITAGGTSKLINVVLEITAPGNFANICIYNNTTGTIGLINCSASIGWSPLAHTTEIVRIDTNAGTVIVDNCDLSTTSRNGALINVAIAGGECDVNNSRLMGAGTHLVCSAGIIRVRNSQYRSIARTAGGNIVDESPELKDTPWHVEKWDWQSVIAQAQVSIRGTPQDAGSGQILLEVTDNVADQEAVESFPEIAGALANFLSPSMTPRFLTQISVDSFDPHVTMFFGLRETPGNAIPGAAEHHAGFDWNGTEFRAINCDGVVQFGMVLGIPSTDTQHQLEVVIIGGVQSEFYVDGVHVWTDPSQVPENSLYWQHLLATLGAGGGDLVQVTVRNGGAQECPA